MPYYIIVSNISSDAASVAPVRYEHPEDLEGDAMSF